MVTEDPREVVRRGYDALSIRYDEHYDGHAKYQAWLSELRDRLPAGRAVLDLGCGSGLPVARDLAAAGYRVTGVDISEAQINRARELVPQAEFVRADVTAIDFAPASFDAVICLFVLIHLPLEDQPPLLNRIASWLRPGGLFLTSTGYQAWTGVDENWLGGGVPMWWSQVALASASRGATPRHTAVIPPACGNANPALPGGAFVWASVPGDGFAGGVGYVMEITNEGRYACSLRGVPGAAVQGGNGHLIGSKLPASGQGPLVTLPPGATAHFLLTIHIAGAMCAHPEGGQVLIYLPGQQQARNGWQTAQACAGLRGGGVLSPGTIEPGVGIPDYDV
ncbi:MAG: methyltransferase domain-containing protein [Streptosporangiaceae bacterium]